MSARQVAPAFRSNARRARRNPGADASRLGATEERQPAGPARELPRGLAELAVRAYSAVDGADADAEVLVLNAGAGGLVEAVLRMSPQVKVTAVEEDAGRARRIPTDGRVEVVTATVQEFFHSWRGPFYQHVLVDVRGSTAGERGWSGPMSDAWQMVAHGGELTGLVSGVPLEADDLSAVFMGLTVHFNGRAYELEEGAFGASGLGELAIVCLNKKGAV